MTNSYDALALFSGGLDSILAARLIMEQGLKVLCVHFTSPFFGHPDRVPFWREVYGLDVTVADIGQDFVDMIKAGPKHGFGKAANPCVDCKIFMASRVRDMLPEYGASFLISGEVLGQRPMSQRRDALYLIRKEARVKDLLLRPLSAQRLDPIPAEESGLVDRSRLLGFSGRGRKDQMALAARYGLTDIPTPAGGCLLAEIESARRYWSILRHVARPLAEDFALAQVGRQYWSGLAWLTVGRDKASNEALEALARPEDLKFKVAGYPGPLALGRMTPDAAASGVWDAATVRRAAAFMASYSPKAVAAGGEVEIRVTSRSGQAQVLVRPDRQAGAEAGLTFAEPALDGLKPDPAADR